MKITDFVNEARRNDDHTVDYTQLSSKVIATLNGHTSGVYTKFAQKLERLEAIKVEAKQLALEIKQDQRDHVAELFDAEDAANTRVVETLQFIFTLSKDPKASVTPKYKMILAELETQLTPELTRVYKKLLAEMVTVVPKAPSLKLTRKDPVEEGMGDVFNKLKNAVLNWGNKYDSKLDALKAKVGM
jgi:RNA-binding protein YhbY